MCITTEDAAAIANTWPERLTTERKIALMLQLKRLELPSRIVAEWLKETSAR